MKTFPPFRLDAADQALWREDQRVPLTPKAFAVLHYLVERAGRLVTQNELLEALWPDTFVQPEVLKSQILDVRAALGDRPRDPLFIETVPRRGYRFIAGVRDLAASPEPAGARQESRLVGRETVLEKLRGSLDRARSGQRQIVFVTGEQGMGKTSVVDSFLREAGGQDIQVARGQCLESFGGVKEPYYPVLEALSQLSRGANGAALAKVLETDAPTWLVQLPALLKPEHREILQRELAGATQERMIREICEALESLTSQSPLLLLFEDLHWSDPSTVDLLSALAHRRAAAKLLVIGTYRPVDIVLSQHSLKAMSQALKAHRLCEEIALGPLVESDVEEYLGAPAGCHEQDESVHALAHWIRKQTEGNPLFMVTMLEHLLQSGQIARVEEHWKITTALDQIGISIPDTLRQMIDLQISLLSPREQLVLGAASVHGMVFPAELAARVLDIDAEGVEDTCQQLADHHHIVRAAGVETLPGGVITQKYEFVHALFRGVLYQRLAPARRAKLHRRFGESLEAMNPGDRAEIAADLAGHFAQCGDWLKTIEYLRVAAKNAVKRFDYQEAKRLLEHALELTRNLDDAARPLAEIRILQRLSIIQHALHDSARVVPTLETLAARAQESNMPEASVRSLFALAMLRGNEDARDGLAVLDRVEPLIPSLKDAEAQAHTSALCETLRFGMQGWDQQRAKRHAAALEQARAGRDRFALASMLMDHSYMQWASSRYADSIRNAHESLPLLIDSGRLVRLLHGLDLISTNLTMLGEWGRALDNLDESIDKATRDGAPERLAMPLLWKAWLHLEAMDYQAVLDLCGRALPSLGSFMRDRTYIGARLEGSAELGLGRVDQAAQKLLDARSAVEARPVMLSWYWRMPLQMDLARAFLAQGDLQQARREADRSVELTQAAADHTWQAQAWNLSARIALLEDDPARAAGHLERAFAAMEGYDVPLASWRVHATAVQVCDRQGSGGRRAAHLSAARDGVRKLAGSLETRPALQKIFLSSPDVAEILEERPVNPA